VTPDCRSLRGRWNAYAADRLAPADHRAFRQHIAACVSCQRAALEEDPVRIFAASRPEELAPEQARAILDNVRAAVAIRQASRRIRPHSARRRSRQALAAASLALLALVPSLSYRRRPPAPVADPRASEIAPEPSAQLPPVDGPDAMVPASATIYEWNPTRAAGDDGPKIVWIVDRSLDI
jgi:hypothetical protein